MWSTSRPCRILHCLHLLVVVVAALVRSLAADSGHPFPGPFSSAAAAGAAEEEEATAPAAAALLESSTARLRAQAKEEPSSSPPPTQPPRPINPTARPPASGKEDEEEDADEDGGDDGFPNLHLNKKLLSVAAAEATALGSALFPQLSLHASSPLLQLQPLLLEPPFVGLREDKWNDDGVSEDDGVRASLALALARAVGRLGELDVAKELYISLLARQHPFPFCAWQVIFDPHVFTPVLLDTNSVYRMQALHFRTRSDVFRITGRFPRVRYFSFQVSDSSRGRTVGCCTIFDSFTSLVCVTHTQSYDSTGQPLTSLPDFLVRERQWHSNPFTNTCLSPPADPHADSEMGTYEIYVTADGQHGYPNELAALRDPSLVVSTTTILYRLYGRDPSVGEGQDDGGVDPGTSRLWGFVDPPIVERRVMGKETWERLPPCSPTDLERVAEGFVSAEQKYLFPLPPQDDVCGLYDKAGRSGIVDRMYPYGHLESRGVSNYVVYTNKDSNYLYWCDSVNRLGRDFLLVLRGQLPRTPAGLYTGWSDTCACRMRGSSHRLPCHSPPLCRATHRPLAELRRALHLHQHRGEHGAERHVRLGGRRAAGGSLRSVAGRRQHVGPALHRGGGGERNLARSLRQRWQPTRHITRTVGGILVELLLSPVCAAGPDGAASPRLGVPGDPSAVPGERGAGRLCCLPQERLRRR